MLVVDDDEHIREVVRRGLLREGCEVVEAADGSAALRIVEAQPLDVVVLDVDLPGSSGLDVLAELRRTGTDLHVILLTAAGTEQDRVLGLVSGADDYVVKPFSVRELGARVTAAHRRRAEPLAQLLQFDHVRIDTTAREVSVDGRPIALARRELDLLIHLATHPGRTFSRQELLQRVWGSSAEWQTAATVTEHVRRLRTKMQPDPEAPSRIVTVRGVGYRFDDDASAARPDDATAPPPGGSVSPEQVTAMAHDLNNVLAVIMNHTEFTREQVADAAEGNPQRWEPVLADVDRIGRGCQRAAGLVRRLLATTAADPGALLPAAGGATPAGVRRASSAIGSSARTVLLVEDDDDMRAAAQRLLSAAGYEVLVAADGATALAIAADHRGAVDLVLTDVQMPDMLGSELAVRLLEAEPSVPVIYMSGYTASTLVSRGILDPGAAVVAKPFTGAGLIDRVGRELDGT